MRMSESESEAARRRAFVRLAPSVGSWQRRCSKGSSRADSNLKLAHAPQRLHDEVSADYNDMIYAT
jgi:hypothetical protein